MKAFTRLYTQLDATTSTNAKVDAMAAYFTHAQPADAAWAMAHLAGRRAKRLVAAPRLREWVGEATGLPAWLVDDCYAHVGDLAETCALLVDANREAVEAAAAELTDPPATDDVPLATWMHDRLLPLRDADDARRRTCILAWWARLPADACFVLNKLLTGGLRVGVSAKLVTRAIAHVSGLAETTVAHRLMGQWQPTAAFYTAVVAAEDGEAQVSRPYPFFLASSLAHDPEAADVGTAACLDETLGDRGDWLAEWKWDGIRAQVVRRQRQTFVWSRGEDLMSGRFPEIEALAEQLPDGTVLDGEIVAWDADARRVLPFSVLQTRIGKRKPGPKRLRESPVTLLAYDVLEIDGNDNRATPLHARRSQLEDLAATIDGLEVSPMVDADDWPAVAQARGQARDRGVEGLMLKRVDSTYQVGRRRGDWWKWKITPMTLDLVLIYAQAGHGRRSGLHTDYTLAARDGDALVPVTKAYSGLTDAELREMDRWIRRNTLERFGPVRSVTPEHVFEIAFEGIAASSRHKSGVALRFPRIQRWRQDLSINDADTLADVRALMQHAERLTTPIGTPDTC